MRYVLQLRAREGQQGLVEWPVDETDMSLALGSRELFDLRIVTPHGLRKVTITSTVEKVAL